jgi:drug/metabolite transporter (DMT)-like permease
MCSASVRLLQGLFFSDTPGGKLVPPTHAKEILTCLLVGLLGYGAQISLTYGLRSAKAAPAIATSYLSVVWGVLAGYFLFDEVRPALQCSLPSSSMRVQIVTLRIMC